MREHQASSTAKMVAMWRALADGGATSVPNFHDPFAARLLTGAYRFWLNGWRRRLAKLPPLRRAKMIARYDTIPIRVVVIDRALRAALARGCRQVVILGAGLDTRAYRMDELVGTTVFEVDHPATQAAKRELVLALPKPRCKLVWTTVDFLRESLAERLAMVGHDASAPTVWIWEGVVMYLSDAAVASSLAMIRERSPRGHGSELILHYHEPSATLRARVIRELFMSWVGEPQIGCRTRAAMHTLVENAGFVVGVGNDWSTAEQAAQIGAAVPEPDSDIANVSRILIAT